MGSTPRPYLIKLLPNVPNSKYHHIGCKGFKIMLLFFCVCVVAGQNILFCLVCLPYLIPLEWVGGNQIKELPKGMLAVAWSSLQALLDFLLTQCCWAEKYLRIREACQAKLSVPVSLPALHPASFGGEGDLRVMGKRGFSLAALAWWVTHWAPFLWCQACLIFSERHWSQKNNEPVSAFFTRLRLANAESGRPFLLGRRNISHYTDVFFLRSWGPQLVCFLIALQS